MYRGSRGGVLIQLRDVEVRPNLSVTNRSINNESIFTVIKNVLHKPSIARRRSLKQHRIIYSNDKFDVILSSRCGHKIIVSAIFRYLSSAHGFGGKKPHIQNLMSMFNILQSTTGITGHVIHFSITV